MATIGVIGAGVMGKDVAVTCAAHGYDVVVLDHDPAVVGAVPGQVRRLVRKYRMMSPATARWSADEVGSRIRVTTDFADLATADWVIENIIENVDAKERVYRRLSEEIGGGEVTVAANTSCISITKLASFMPRPDLVIGMHFMNPVPLIDGVEVIRGVHTSDDTVKAADALVTSLGKQAIVVNDMPGFVSNRLSHLFMNEAAFLVQDGVADPDQIDAVFTLGYGHAMGPLKTADLIGLDTVVDSLAVLHQEFQDPKFRCCPLLKKMVAAGNLGQKSGQGFYSY